MRRAFRRILDRITGVEATVRGMKVFCRTKKRMFLPIRDKIDGVLSQLEELRFDTEWVEGEPGGDDNKKAGGEEAESLQGRGVGGSSN